MRSAKEWMREYAISHTHPTNVLIHKVFVPLIMLSLLGMMWVIPRPEVFPPHDLFNWATLFVTAVMIYYFFISIKLAMGMLLLVGSMMAILLLGHSLWGFNLLWISITIFIVSWVFQFIGHKIEGKKPSFFQDLQFLLIGPLWVLNSLYRKLGISI